MASLALPTKAATDAAHIGLAVAHGMHSLMTWNCTHIATVNEGRCALIFHVTRPHGQPCHLLAKVRERQRARTNV